MAATPIQKKTIIAQVAEEIRRQILLGEYPGGLQLRQEHIAAEMGIAISDANWQFHALLYAPSERTFTIELVAKMHRQLERYTRLMVSRDTGRNHAVREHFDLARLCRKRDVVGALALLRPHILAGSEFLIQRISALRAAETREPPLAKAPALATG